MKLTLKNVYRISKSKQLVTFSIYFFLFAQFFGNALVSISLALVIISIVTYGGINYRTIEIGRSKAALLFICFFSSYALSVVINLNRFQDILVLKKVLLYLYFPILFLLILDLFKQESFRKNCKISYIFGAASSFLILLFTAAYKYAKTGNSIFFVYNHLADSLGIQPIYLGVFYLLAAIFCVDLAVLYKGKIRKIFGALFLVLVFGILLMASRTGWFLAFVILPIKLFPYLQFNRVFLLLGTLVVVIFSTIVIASPTLNQRLFKANQNVASYSGIEFRLKLWDNALSISKESPVLGFGLHESEKVLQQRYISTNFRRAFLAKLNTHNQYIQTLLDAGILGVGLLFLLFGFGLIKFGSKDMYLFLAIIAISFLTESFLRRFNGILFFTFFYFFHLYRRR